MNMSENRLATFFCSLLILSSSIVFAGHASADDDEIWKASANEFIKYADQDESSFGRNDHPVALNARELSAVLEALKIQGKDDSKSAEELKPVFTAEQAKLLGQNLAKGLRSANPNQDIIFALQKSVDRFVILKPARYFVAGRAFNKDNKLNVIIGDYNRLREEAFEAAYDPTNVGILHYKFDHGSRTKRSKEFDKTIMKVVGIVNKQINGSRRDDWLVIDVRTALAALDQMATMRKNEEMARRREELREILGSEEAIRPSAPAAPAAAPAPVGRGISWQELEEGLTTLNRLREQGLITDEDYETKKQQMLDALGTW
jgi:hypothetical protein